MPPKGWRKHPTRQSRLDKDIERAEKKAIVPGTWDLDLELELLRDFGRKRFWFFFYDIFGAGTNPKGERWIDPSIHEPLCDWFQGHVEDWHRRRTEGHGRQKHLAVILPRELGKTTLFTQAGQAWLHLRDPELSSFTGSESTALSAKILDGLKAILDGSDPHSLFTKLYGNWSTAARSWTGKQVTHSARKNTSRKDPSLGIFSVETSITGAHPDVIFYDDPISYERLTTDANWLQTVNSQVTSLFPVIQSDGLVIWVGTRYDDDDHFGVAFRDEGVRSLTGMETDQITVEPEVGKWDVYFLAGRNKEGLATCPMVWPERRLKDFERRDPLRYAAQVLNDPSLSETNPITREQLAQCKIPSSEVPWGALRYAFITDTAFWDGKSRARKDETVIEVWGYPRNGSGDVYFIEGYGSNLWRAEEFGSRLVQMVQRYRSQGKHIFALCDEVTMAGKKDAWRLALQNMFHDAGQKMPNWYEFQRGHASIRGQAGTKKIHRIVAAASFWVDGHVRVVENAPGSERLLDQMARIGQMMYNPKMKDDWVDAAADAFQPELYQPMRRISQQKAPWERGGQVLRVEGLDLEMFEDDSWTSDMPRPVIK